MRLGVATWNLGGAPPEFPSGLDAAMRRAGETTLRHSPAIDVIGFQEVFFPANLERLEAVLAPAYVRIPSAAVAVKSGAPWPLLIQSPLLFGPLATSWRLRQGGLALFVRRDGPFDLTRAPAARFHPYAAEAPAYRLYEGDGYADKGIQEAVLPLRDGGEIALLNTHVQAQYRARHRRYRAVRSAQLEQLAEIGNRHGSARPVIVLGDLNTRPDEADVYPKIAAHWRDLTIGPNGRPAPATSIGSEKNPPAWIDYVLGRHPAADGIRTRQVALITEVEPPASDHHGLFAQLSIDPVLAESGARLPLAGAWLASGASSRRTFIAGGAISIAELVLPQR
jgi:endonuclease/exonuclease/phosphatase family metal-dependent hydrolase